MPTMEIRSTDWTAFCEKFLNLHRGQLMTIFQINESGREVEVARDMPLQNIIYTKDACNDHIQINLFQEGKREVNHDIIEPIHVKVREESAGTKALQVDAENGSTILRFSSGKYEQLLEGLEPL